MDIILICWAAMLSLAVVFVICEYIINKKFKDESPIKKWWRRNIVSVWDSNHPRV
jgi:hypothetical protein